MEEDYIIEQARKSNPATAKAFLLTAKTLFPNNFQVQYESYKIEKSEKNHLTAAKCFSNLITNFSNLKPVELYHEVTELTTALKIPESETTEEQDFFVKMFEHLSAANQHQILLLTVNNTENQYDQCKLLLLLLKRFPQAIITHSPRLLEMIAAGMVISPGKYQEMLIEEALPLIYHKTPELPGHLVCRIFTTSLEYYIKQMFIDENKLQPSEAWKQIFQILNLCGKILNWEQFLPYNKNWSKDVYWQKLIHIVTKLPMSTTENNQIFFYAVTLFLFSLQEYISQINQNIDDNEIEFVMVEGFREWKEPTVIRPLETTIEPPKISVPDYCNKDTPIAFVTCSNCWQLLNSYERSTLEFSNLLINLPLSNWISRFLHDLAVYFSHHEEAKKLMINDMQVTGLRHNIRILGLILTQGPLTIQGFDAILQIIHELPIVPGKLLNNMTIISKQRHLILLPLTQKSIIQYCTKAIINSLSRKIFELNCTDLILGNLLVLTQLEYPRESELAEQIFAIIKTKRQFTYLLFPTYIISIDYIEEFMNIWNSNNGEFYFELSLQTQGNNNRRMGTRGTDKGVKDDFKLIIKHQITRWNDNLPALIAQFIQSEHLHLIQSMF